MPLTKVIDLVGQDVRGKSADVRCRVAGGALLYPENGNKIRNLIKVEQKTEKNGVWDYSTKPPTYSKKPFRWTRLIWEKASGGEYDCGFAGRREDCATLNDWHILID